LVEHVPKPGEGVLDPLAVIDSLQDVVLSAKAVDGRPKRPSECSAIGRWKNQEAVVEARTGRTRAYAKLQMEAAKI
jgi:hypothetical protein